MNGNASRAGAATLVNLQQRRRAEEMAGIWQAWDKGDAPLMSCVVVTCSANAAMAPIHDRLPVILKQDDWPLWLGEAGHCAAVLLSPIN
jgi:putative SOS response-associated peptidase YedK